MQAVILAGGMGTRLRPLTEQVPKVMLPVNDKPFLLHLLELLKSCGLNDVILCTGYLGEQVKDFFKGGDKLGIRIRYSQERGRLMGTGGALRQAQHLLDERFFVINGDTYLPIDYKKVEMSFIRCGKKALMVVYDNDEATGVKNNVELNGDLLVVRHDKESHDLSLKYVEAGVLALTRQTLGLVEDRSPISLEKGLYPALIQQKELAAYITTQRFYDIGTPEQIKVFQEFLMRERK